MGARSVIALSYLLGLPLVCWLCGRNRSGADNV